MKRWIIFCFALVMATLWLSVAAPTRSQDNRRVYLPLVAKPVSEPEPLVEFRGLWVTRFDWTTAEEPANPARLDEIVQNAAAAGFNVLFFQVRATADAYYAPGLEPWAQRMSGVALGQPPFPYWDPLAYLIARAHTHNIQVHAYLNAYPVWFGCNTLPDAAAAPTHFYYQLLAHHGSSDDQPNGLQWDRSRQLTCHEYLRATPASPFANDHLVAVAADLVTRYGIDGIHLDHLRYSHANTSCDPVSHFYFGADCFSRPDYGDWQRAQVNQTVRRFYQEVIPLKPGLWLSAAVWPIYINKPAWGWPDFVTQGYHDYYQDSKAWLAGGYIDSISPMIYPGVTNCPDNSFWTPERWQTLAADFQADSNGRYVIPGIGAGYCTFDEIAARITMARKIGVAGHAIFSYTGLRDHGYFEDLANGPYAQPAIVPSIPWHP